VRLDLTKHNRNKAALVQKGPARDAFVATVNQQLVDRLHDCCQFIRGGKAEVNFKAPTAPLTTMHADPKKKAIPMVTQQMETTSATKTKGSRRSERIAAARSLTVVAEDPSINNGGADNTKELRLLAKVCTFCHGGGHSYRTHGRQEGEDSTLDSQLGCDEGESALGVIKERFYEYPKKVVALLELGYLTELEEGVFLRRASTQRKLHPDLSGLARRMQEANVNRKPLRRC
jgi:hypothetical protein